MPSSPSDVQKLAHDGYTLEKYLGAWEETFRVYDKAFPNQCVSLATGKRNIALVERANRVFGRRLAIQDNDLHAGRAPRVEAPDNTDFIKGYSGQIITGFEMRGGSRGPSSKVMGAEGDPVGRPLRPIN